MSNAPDFNKLHDGMFEIGLQNRRQVVGNAYVDAALHNGSSEFAYPGQQLVTEYEYLQNVSKERMPTHRRIGGVGEMCGHAQVWNANSAAF